MDGNRKYISLVNVTPEERRTKILEIRNTETVLLGEIRFWGAWRQYTFQPTSETLFDAGCLQDITEKLDKMNKEIRQEWKERRQINER